MIRDVLEQFGVFSHLLEGLEGGRVGHEMSHQSFLDVVRGHVLETTGQSEALVKQGHVHVTNSYQTIFLNARVQCSPERQGFVGVHLLFHTVFQTRHAQERLIKDADVLCEQTGLLSRYGFSKGIDVIALQGGRGNRCRNIGLYERGQKDHEIIVRLSEGLDQFHLYSRHYPRRHDKTQWKSGYNHPNPHHDRP